MRGERELGRAGLPFFGSGREHFGCSRQRLRSQHRVQVGLVAVGIKGRAVGRDGARDIAQGEIRRSGIRDELGIMESEVRVASSLAGETG